MSRRRGLQPFGLAREQTDERGSPHARRSGVPHPSRATISRTKRTRSSSFLPHDLPPPILLHQPLTEPAGSDSPCTTAHHRARLPGRARRELFPVDLLLPSPVTLLSSFLSSSPASDCLEYGNDSPSGAERALVPVPPRSCSLYSAPAAWSCGNAWMAPPDTTVCTVLAPRRARAPFTARFDRAVGVVPYQQVGRSTAPYRARPKHAGEHVDALLCRSRVAWCAARDSDGTLNGALYCGYFRWARRAGVGSSAR
ncbi:hypothetical protein C8J57DRAFT_1504220 [Mycena rebaudengoi]|nr:hypothetical protein C8J57DRAFT_1504220 [Mycena rebaudengoi]